MMEMSELPQSTVLYLYSDRDRIEIEPEYQRVGDIWTIEKRQLLIDSILNGFDIPKIYVHKHSTPKKNKDNTPIKYSIVDGRQRLEAIWKFIDGDFSLADDFCFIEDESKKVGPLTYNELATKYPQHKLKFDSYRLSVVGIQTDNLDIIEDMFSRLNEAVPLNAPEKRNAFGGPLPAIIRSVAKHPFFTKNLPIRNKRYQHYDLALKFLLLEWRKALVDTKKVYLDRFVRDRKTDSDRGRLNKVRRETQETLAAMSKVFTERDALLTSIGSVVLYYFLFQTAMKDGWDSDVTRSTLEEFESERKANRKAAQENFEAADYDLLEFDRYAQAPNDAYALKIRFNILIRRAFRRNWEITAGN